jgi:hypothetical protein
MPINPNRSDLDQQQIFQRAFDEPNDRIRVDAEITASIIAPPGLEVSISAVDDNIAIRNSNNTNELLINADGSINIAGIVTSPTVNQGTANTVANAWPIKLTDGIDTATINADGSINVANVVSVIASTASLTSISSSTSSQTVLAANPVRKGFLLFNDSTATCYVAFAATSSTALFTMKLIPGMTYQNEAIIYTGVMSAIWDVANGALRVTELV